MSSMPAAERCPHCDAQQDPPLEAPTRGSGVRRCTACEKPLSTGKHVVARPGRSMRRRKQTEALTKPLGGPRPAPTTSQAERPAPDAPPAEKDPPLTPPPSPSEEVRSEQPEPESETTRETEAEAPAAESPPTPDALDFGDYWLLGEIGRGGSGVLYRARAKHGDEIVALRVVQAVDGLDESWLDRFEADQDAVLNLDHPAIVAVLDVGEHLGSPYVVLPLLAGETLEQCSKASDRAVRSSLRIVATIARALHHAHSRGVVHGGIQPSNIVLDPDLGPRILDFGLSRALAPGAVLTDEACDLTGANGYLSPEQVRGESDAIDARSDVFSLGAVLHELLAGSAPFHAQTMRETLSRVLQDQAEPVSDFHPEADPDLDAIVAQALRKAPEDRYPSTAAFADDLDRYLAGEAVWAERPSRMSGAAERLSRWRRPFRIALLLVGIAVLGLTGARLWFEPPAVEARANLSSPDASVRAATLRTLFRDLNARTTTRQSEVLVALAMNALEDPAEQVRLVALRQLPALSDAIHPGHPLRRTLERQLSRSLSPDHGDDTLTAAMHTIVILDVRGAGPAVVALAENDEIAPATRARALTLLGDLPIESGFDALMAAFAEGGEVRQTAYKSLERLTEQLVDERTAGADDVEEHSTSPSVTRRSAHSDDRESAAVLAILDRLGGVTEVRDLDDPVLAAIQHSSSRARLAAVWAIVHTNDPRGATLLVTALADAYPPVGRAAAAGLTAYGGPRLERQLTQALSLADPQARANAASAIGEIRMRGASLQRLYQAMHGEEIPFAREAMARALGRIGERAAVPHLIRLLDDADPGVQEAVDTALRTLAGEDLDLDRAAWQSWWDALPPTER